MKIFPILAVALAERDTDEKAFGKPGEVNIFEEGFYKPDSVQKFTRKVTKG